MRAYARHRGVSPEAVSKAVKQNRITTIERDGKRLINPKVADQEWEENTAQVRKTTPTKAERDGFTPAANSFKENLSNQEQFVPRDSSEAEPATGASKLSLNKSRAVREAYLAKLAEIEYKEKTGKLVSADAQRVAAYKTARIVRDTMLNLPEKLAQSLAIETDPHKIQMILTKAITEALEELSRAAPAN